ncbi:lysophospholipid acyltransferase family protein [Kaistia algarum]|nr:lysophospholipid acyltransferase family protein [Kaistia algarum]
MKKPRRIKDLLKRLGNSDRVIRFVGLSAVGYLRLVRSTSRIVFEPESVAKAFGDVLPGIMTMWHGQHLMAPFVPNKGIDLKVMVSRHRDGEINAIVAEKFGFGTIRASAARDPSRVIEKGGLRGFLEMKAALAEGTTVAMTADLSNMQSRRAGLGIIMLAQNSGRPILPVALATSRRIRLSNWDRTTFNLPFSRGACIFGNPIFVPAGADDETREAKRRELEDELNRVNAIAYERIGLKDD